MTPRPFRLSADALAFSLLVAAYVPLRFIIPLPQLVPGQPALTAILLIGVGAYWLLDFVAAARVEAPRWLWRGKWLLVTAALMLIAIGPTLMIVFVRHQSAPYLWAHDGLIQNEIAVDYVLAGRNPYVEDYSDTILALAPFKVGNLTDNPALQHYVYLPLTFLLQLPVQALFKSTVGWFDQRFLHLALFVGVLALVGLLTRRPERRLLVIMILGLNPLSAAYLIEGRNDILTLFWVVLAIVLARRSPRWAAAAVGLACITKHTAWFFAPFLLLYVAGHGTLMERTRRVWQPAVVFLTVVAAGLLPWMIMNGRAFFEDAFGSIVGTASPVYPISGLGFGGALVSIGVLSASDPTFPFWLFQLITFGPLTLWLLARQWRANHLASALSGYALTLFVFTYFSRLFNDNYWGYALALMALAALMDDPGEQATPSGGLLVAPD